MPYITDGSLSGTQRLANEDTGASSFEVMSFGVVLGGHAFFPMDDRIHGYELWRTDGTPEGTELVSDIQPGVNGSEIRDIAVFKGMLLLSASGPSNKDEDSDGVLDPGGFELWRSDGTEAGTVLLKDIESELSISGSLPENFTVLNDRMVFTATTESSGEERLFGARMVLRPEHV